MKRGGRGADILAVLASVGIHALLLLIPWQPAAGIDLIPLEGSGVVELAVLQPVRGETEAQQQKAPEPIVEPKPEQAAREPKPEPVRPVAVEEPKPQQPEVKPNVSITPVVEKPATKPPEDVLTGQSSQVVIPPPESTGTTEPQNPIGTAGDETETKAPEQARPQYPGDDPTGEAMVASKRAIAYPKESMNASSEGVVTVEAAVEADGTIRSVKVLSGPEDEWMRRNAEQTILRYWVFRQADWAYRVTIQVSFRMSPVAETSLKFIGASFLD